MTIRPATLADIPAMIALAAHIAIAAQWTEFEYQNMILQVGNVTRHCLVLEEEGRVQAFLVARELKEEWEIENIAVAGMARRRGLGMRLLGEAFDMARSRGARSIFLEVRESNQAARALYEKCKFFEIGRRKGYYSDPVEDACVYKFSFVER